LETDAVSNWTRKGRHTTRTAVLHELDFGGWVVDTPGIRQMQLWDVRLEEVECFFIEFRPFVPGCRFPDCSHTHESSCAVKQAVDRDLISPVRYASYLKIMTGED
jgi:ribosome biogenesis GTPase